MTEEQFAERVTLLFIGLVVLVSLIVVAATVRDAMVAP